MTTPLATAADVQAVGDFDIVDFDPYITTAHVIVEQFLLDKNMGTPMLTQIEIYLAAHFAAVKDPRVRQVAIHSGNVTYALPLMGQGLLSTPYGQQALSLDFTNTLFMLGRNRATARQI